MVSTSNKLSVISTNATNNTAVIEYVVTCQCSGSSYNAYSQTGTFYIDGTKYTASYALPQNKTTTVFSKQVTISNASGRTINASYSFPSTPYYGTQSGNASVKVPTLDLVKAPIINSLVLKSRTLTSLTFSYGLNANANTVYYKLSTSSNYTQIRTNTQTGDFTISGLNPNTSYTINFLARNTSGSTNKDATQNVSGTTFAIGQITNVSNFEHGSNTSITITNPSRKYFKLSDENWKRSNIFQNNKCWDKCNIIYRCTIR